MNVQHIARLPMGYFIFDLRTLKPAKKKVVSGYRLPRTDTRIRGRGRFFQFFFHCFAYRT